MNGQPLFRRVREHVQPPWPVVRRQCVEQRVEPLSRQLTHRRSGHQGRAHQTLRGEREAEVADAEDAESLGLALADEFLARGAARLVMNGS